MEKEKILSTLNEKLGQTSLSERTISDYIDDNMPAEGAEFDFDRHVKFLKSLNGNFSHDVAASVEDFKKNYKPETKHDKPENKDDPGKIGALEKQIEDLKKLFGEQNAKNSANALRKEAASRGESLKVVNKAIWEDAVNSVTVGENDSADNVVANAKKEYERLLKRYMGDGASPYGSSGRQGATKEAEEAAKGKREALKKKMQARGRLPKPE